MITITKFYGNGKRTVERLDSNVPKRSKTNVEEHNDVPCCSSTPVQPYRTVRGIPHDDEVLHDSDRDTEGLPSDSESEDSVFESYLSFPQSHCLPIALVSWMKWYAAPTAACWWSQAQCECTGGERHRAYWGVFAVVSSTLSHTGAQTAHMLRIPSASWWLWDSGLWRQLVLVHQRPYWLWLSDGPLLPLFFHLMRPLSEGMRNVQHIVSHILPQQLVQHHLLQPQILSPSALFFKELTVSPKSLGYFVVY